MTSAGVMTKRCRRCRYEGRKPAWRCAGCGATCCEHMCSLKTTSGIAVCCSCKKVH